MRKEDKDLAYLNRWGRILSNSGMTEAEIGELLAAIRSEIEPMKSRIAGMETQINEMLRKVQHTINEHKKEVSRELLNKVTFKTFVGLEYEVRKLQGIKEKPFGYEEAMQKEEEHGN